MKRAAAVLAAAFLCLSAVSCRGEDEGPFGMKIRDWNPLVVYADDPGGRGKVFSRDPSLISAVTNLFEQPERAPVAGERTDPQGVAFSVSTMYGMFDFGRCDGKRIWVGTEEYMLEEDCSEELWRLFSLMEAETQQAVDVPVETILAVRPEMTYRELLDLFGETLQTSTVGATHAYLYQDGDRPFYITFERETDAVGETGEQLLEDIRSQYNLSQLLKQPDPLKGGRADAYTAVFGQLLRSAGLDASVKTLQLDMNGWVHLDEGDREAIRQFFAEKYTVEELPPFAQPPYGGATAAALRVEKYTYVGSKTMTFFAGIWVDGEQAAAAWASCTWKDGKWSAALTDAA